MKYIVVDNTSLAKMMERVNEYVELGWLPRGGMSVYREGVSGSNHFVQALFQDLGRAQQTYAQYKVVQPRKKHVRKAVAVDNSHNAP